MNKYALRPLVAIAVLFFSMKLLYGVFGGYSVGAEKLASRSQWSDNGYQIGIETSLVKVFQSSENCQSYPQRHVSLTGARNEYESFQILLIPQSGDLENIKIESSPLTCHARGDVVGQENIFLFQVGYVETKKSAYRVTHIGWWPDPLIPLRNINVKAGTIQPIWVLIHIPENTTAGHYQGSISIIAENAAQQNIEIDLTVWDFILPQKPNFQAIFSLYEGTIRDYYQLEEIPSELLRQYYSFLLAHRINPTSLYLSTQMQPGIEDLEFCIDRGLNAFNIAYLYDWQGSGGRKVFFSEQFRVDLQRSLRQRVTFLEDRQLLDEAFIYGPDEPSHRDLKAVREIFTYVDSIAPGVRRVLTRGPEKELYGYVDVWVPRIDKFNEQKCRQRKQLGDEIWWYICASPRHPFPNFFLDYPAIDHRIIFWMTWKYNITGFLYYSINRWVTNFSENGRRWPETPWNTRTYGKFHGDGQLIYPGPEGEPYSSIRLEVIRDGLEDYEYLHMLQARYEEFAVGGAKDAAQLLRPTRNLMTSIQEKMIKDLTHYTKDTEQLLSYRQEVAREIQRLEKLIDQYCEASSVENIP